MIAYIFDQIPWWLYLLLGGLAAGALFYFFSPILIPLWAATPKSVKIALGAVGAAFLAFIYGLNRGNRNARDLQAKQDAQAVQKRTETDDEVGKLSDPAVDKRLDRWMRDSK
jgi:hypothetical protein